MGNLLTTFESSSMLRQIYDISTPEKRAKAYTEVILMDYARYIIEPDENGDIELELPDTPEAKLFEMLLSQLWCAREDAWMIPAPENRDGFRNIAGARESYSCLAEWLTHWLVLHSREAFKGTWMERNKPYYRDEKQLQVAENWSDMLEDPLYR